ncbi:MAG: hypothetical protein QOH90_468 [Actinomycetota bacterium]|jgi:YesN/AraC family two-component response regulator|nr:hypothetical protein [Actinomycetota bacterium]
MKIRWTFKKEVCRETTDSSLEEACGRLRLWRIVIADDVVYFRTLLRYALDPKKFEVVGEAGDGAEAIEQVRTQRPDALILDLSMPVMDGLQAIPQIRKDAPETKILVLSGFDAVAMADQAMKLGAHSYLEKGIEIEDISDALTALCEGDQRPIE